MAIDYTKLRRKLTPEPEIDGDPGIRLKVGTVAAIDSSTGLVTLNLNGATVPAVPSLSGTYFDVGTVVQVLSFRGALLILGASNAASAQPVEASGSASVNGTITGTTAYTASLATSGIHGVVFVAPPSGKALLLGRSVGGNSNAGSYAQMDFEVRTGSTIGSGTLVRSSNNNTAAVHQSATANAQGTLHINSLLRNFLTPGAVYNAYLTFATSNSGSTAQFNRRQIAVYPQ
jgi:hypothetical protein